MSERMSAERFSELVNLGEEFCGYRELDEALEEIRRLREREKELLGIIHFWQERGRDERIRAREKLVGANMG